MAQTVLGYYIPHSCAGQTKTEVMRVSGFATWTDRISEAATPLSGSVIHKAETIQSHLKFVGRSGGSFPEEFVLLFTA